MEENLLVQFMKPMTKGNSGSRIKGQLFPELKAEKHLMM
jgi:hypothetical protein